MPHILVEYSDNLKNGLDVPRLLETLHDTLSAQGVDKARIKTRAIALADYLVGAKGASGQMIHVTLLILEGRDLATKKSFGDPLYKALKDHAAAKFPDCAATLEIRDMVKDTYYM